MKVLITGGGGFLGAWLVRRLLDAGIEVRIFDLGAKRDVVAAQIGLARADALEWHTGDISQYEPVLRAAEGCDQIIHLAGVLTPACRDQPWMGLGINVTGTLNIFEAAKACGIRRVIYTSSGGVFGPKDTDTPLPTTLYGTWKLANEGIGRTYWHEAGIANIGFRPFVVYGPGRETGLSAGPTLACKAAAMNQPYMIPISGKAGMVYVDDVAAAYCAAVQADLNGAYTMNLPGQVASMDDVASLIREQVPTADIRVAGSPLPSAYGVANDWSNGVLQLPPETSLRDGIRQTIAFYTR